MTTASARVMPFESGDTTGIPLADLNPDTDGDGHIQEWEKEVYSRIVAADTDHTGTISVRNLYDFIHKMSNEVKEAAKGGIPISSLDPDTDGDGKVEPWENEVFARIKSADMDDSGSISVKELFGVIKGAAESDKQKKLFQRLLGVAMLIILLLVGAMLGMGIVAGEAVKESHVKGQAMTTPMGDAVQVEPARSYLTLFEMPRASIDSLAKMEALTMYVDMSDHPAVGGWVEASYKVSGAYKRSDDVAYLSTPEGHVITLDALQGKGTIAMAGPGGATYDLSDQTPPERRQLVRRPEPPFHTARQMQDERRRLGFFSALMTSGSFMMMQAGAF